MDADTRLKPWTLLVGAAAVQRGDGLEDREPGENGALGIIFMRLWVAEVY